MLGFQGGVSIPLVKGGVKAPPAKRQCRAGPKAGARRGFTRIVGERIRGIAMMVVTINIVAQTPHMLAQGVIKHQECISFWPAYLLGLLEYILDATVVDAVVKPRRFGEKVGEIGFVRTLQDTAGDVRQAFVVQNDQACQIMLKMMKLAPILEEVSEDIRMSSHEGSGGHDRKLHQAIPFRVEDGIGPESITGKSAMAKYNTRVIYRSYSP
jgi:hypothetical protein